jgi:glycosyltransferase involved in cell wall biosynthesis
MPSPRNAGDHRSFLFLGRIMPYKGLPLFVEACELLRGKGHHFGVGVIGEGFLGDAEPRLRALGASIVNRWVSHDEISALVGSYGAVVTSHIEASQSGVIPMAHALGLPVLTTPVGGLPEQVDDGVTGLVARETSAIALAAVMERYLTDPELRQRLATGARQVQAERSIGRFVEAVLAV